MKKENISVTDLERILLGEAPAEFLLEVLLRSLVSYLILLIILRLMGKRMSGKLTHTEMSVMLMFGAVVSSSMQIPDRGVLESSFVLLLILLFQRGVTLWTVRSNQAENKILGKMALLVKTGKCNWRASKMKLFRKGSFSDC